jgi:thiol-disulfide isomerase/thioredoxin
MTVRFCLLLAWFLVFSARGETLQMDTLKVGSTTYTNVTILGANTTDLYFRHSLGLANVKLKYVSPDLQKRFEYNPKAAAEAEKRQVEEDRLYETSLAKAEAAPAGKTNDSKRPGALGSETGLADPVSDTSLLGKAGPKLEVDKWLGEKPVLDGKFVLIAFWAPWSSPCRQWIPELNALQKKFTDKLIVLGITSGPEAALNDMPDPRADFLLGIDSKSKIGAAAGVTSVPCMLLCDPKGMVLYEGHPGAITEKKLQALLANASG